MSSTALLSIILMTSLSFFAIDTFHCSSRISYQVDCNRCWCVLDGIPVCTRMLCSSIPKKYWRFVKLSNSSRSNNLLRLLPTLLKIKSRWKPPSRESAVTRFFKDLDTLKHVADANPKTRSKHVLRRFFQEMDKLKNVSAPTRKRRSDLVLRGFFNNLKRATESRRRSKPVKNYHRQNNGSGTDLESINDLLGDLITAPNADIGFRLYEDVLVLNESIDY